MSCEIKNEFFSPWLLLSGEIFERQKYIEKGFVACVYFIVAPDKRFYIGKKTLLGCVSDFETYGGSAKDIKYRKMADENPEKFERYVVDVFKTQQEALDVEEKITRLLNDKGIELWMTEECVNLRPGGHGFGSNAANPMKKKENQEKLSKATTENWKDPVIRNKRISGIRNKRISGMRKPTTEETIRLLSQISTENWRDPVIRKKRMDGIEAFHKNKDGEKRQAWCDKIGKNSKNRWKNDEYREKMIAIIRKNGIPIVFGFKKRKFILETTKDWKKYLERSDCGGSLYQWLNGNSTSYEKYGLDFVRRFDKNDEIDEFENPWNDKEIKEELKIIFKQNKRKNK